MGKRSGTRQSLPKRRYTTKRLYTQTPRIDAIVDEPRNGYFFSGFFISLALGTAFTGVQSMANGSAFMSTVMRYSSSNVSGTRHEYEQVKLHPNSNLPCLTSSPLLLCILKLGGDGRSPFTIRLLTSSPPEPNKLSVSRASFLSSR